MWNLWPSPLDPDQWCQQDVSHQRRRQRIDFHPLTSLVDQLCSTIIAWNSKGHAANVKESLRNQILRTQYKVKAQATYAISGMDSAISKAFILPGSAVSKQNDRVFLASPSLLATHIATTGASLNGVVTMTASGNVTLDDWSEVAGKTSLIPGQTYYVSSGGKLSTTGNQPVGIASSKQTLSVTIQSLTTTGSAAASTSGLQSQINQLATDLGTLAAQMPNLVTGSFSIPNGVNTATITGLGLTFTPTRAICTVRIPVNGLILAAAVVSGTITTDGFAFLLNGLTDSVNYVLDYIIT